ncbi:hypothetical protein W97_07492 [Coniosporium apollinis CBS 100218]|uniref:Non-repetitive nucleoporin n=1 Tax=Coniosporium apollinis (strain CBS 100218) TaxID=1168221 RepID=R7Z2I2_CONA1|nr:uncharacterized protein W97_07492 [Coniosporium apollinis CBS 100218]EON68234.1 hypothetical protein W97_07492 [Coniosporium apollinis CBS 100218]
MTPAPSGIAPPATLNKPASIFRMNTIPNMQQLAAQQPGQLAPPQHSGASAPTAPAQSPSHVQRGAQRINDALSREASYPALDTYINRTTEGISSDYDINPNPAWAPFQRLKTYEIPDRIFEQYNRAQVSTMMGLFAELNHAWVTIDNALYLWDYTHPNPELIGFEEQPNNITAVRLVVPRPKVFVDQITHLLVVATTSEIILIGVASQRGPEGVHGVSLYQTRMQVPIKGIDVSCIEGSRDTGRIFFGGRTSDDVYELTYQQEEKWFANRCGKVNHVTKGISAVVPSISFGHKGPPEHVVQMAVDDTRKLLYTLSSESTIRVFHMKPPNTLDLALTRRLSDFRTQMSHMIQRTELLGQGVKIVSINPISSTEASRINLMAVTSTGCRIFFSATTSYYTNDASAAPTSMQVHHVKFPPGDRNPAQSPTQGSSTQVTSYQGGPAADTNSRSLVLSRAAARFPPGYFFCFVQRSQQRDNDTLFVSAPDTGRIARPQESTQLTRFVEQASWIPLGSVMADIGLVTKPFAAARTPPGFGNELAVQFDTTTSEIAILTNNGIHTMRRRRLVDMFASMIRHSGGGQEGVEGEVKNFLRVYGRVETAATALAVACGQGSDVNPEYRGTQVADNDVLEHARRIFIEHGGKATINENSLLDQGASAVDRVQPSPRHDGLALYISRLVRSVWKEPILKEAVTPTGGLTVTPTVPLDKLRKVQHDLTRLQEFLDANKTFIDGLAGSDALGRVVNRQEEVALQGEHVALTSLVRLISNIIEGISFVLVLADERVDEVIFSLNDTVRQQVRQLTFEGLFCSEAGANLARELVKAIVDRNIKKGSNVETVAESLRRRCGSFCSADDVVIFKAQEQLNRAAETGATSETGRAQLNESLRQFEKVAASLSMRNLQDAVNAYISMAFYAGAIRLALQVAQQRDRGNRALSWLNDGRPEQDPRKEAYESRARCYDLICAVINKVDEASQQAPPDADGQYSAVARRRDEAYEQINSSEDEVFHTYLYDWYLHQEKFDRLLEIESPYIITYLQRKAHDNARDAELLCRYYARHHSFFEAATVQLQLAKSSFDLSLQDRIEYLSRAKTNASTRITGMGDVRLSRQSRQELTREVSDLLDVANIQEDILTRLRDDARATPERREEIVKSLSGQILPLQTLFEDYADQAGYYDICLLIYHAADHREKADIRATWQNWIQQLHDEATAAGEAKPYEVVAERVRSLGRRVHLSESVFDISLVLPLLSRYAYTHQRSMAPLNWPTELLLSLGVPHETLISVLESLFYNEEAPFMGRARRYPAENIVYVAQRWLEESLRQGGPALGGVENCVAVSETLGVVLGAGVLDEIGVERARGVREAVEACLRG